MPVLGRSQPSNWRVANGLEQFPVTLDSVSDVIDILQSDVIGGAAVRVNDRDCSVVTLSER